MLLPDYKLENIDVEEVEDFLTTIEESFKIHFLYNELGYVRTFGQLCDHISNKLNLEHSEGCTSQQAFYKLKLAIETHFNLTDKSIITPQTSVDSIFPRKERRRAINEIENQLGFKLKILRSPYWITSTFIIILLASFFILLMNWIIGLSGIIISIFGLKISNAVGIEFDVKSLGEVAKKMTRENYLNSRRNSNSINKDEIEKVLIDLFSDRFQLDKSKLTKDAKFSNAE